MLDLRWLRLNADAVRADLAKRQAPDKLKLLEEVFALDAKRKTVQAEMESTRASRNTASKKISELVKAKASAKEIEKAKTDAAAIPDKVAKLDAQTNEILADIRSRLMRLPNILHESVPVGKDDAENVTVRTWGKPSTAKAKSHVDWMLEHGQVELEKSALISGARFYALKDQLVLLDHALQRFALDHLYKKGFTLVSPPHMLRKSYYEGTTDLSEFERVMYRVDEKNADGAADDDLYLIATSEHALVAMNANEVLDFNSMPGGSMKLAGISRCFRKEAGAHGKDQKGIFRVHEFNKIEQVAFCKPEDSWALHEELLTNTEELFQALEIPYRVVNVCTGDIGTVAAKKYDIEAWMPAQQAFREVASCSNCTTYQAVRSNIRYQKSHEEREFVHSLNNTALATSRAIVALIENHQEPDGRVRVPKALQPYLNGWTHLGQRKESKSAEPGSKRKQAK